MRKKSLLLLLLSSAPVVAQTCAVPPDLAALPADPVIASEVVHVPTVGYKLTFTWAPGFCRDRADPANAECAAGRTWVLHGLWPDGANAVHPRYCAAVGPVDLATLRQAYCLTPSPKLIAHEWAAHGSCGWPTPAAYYAQAGALVAHVHLPDIAALGAAPIAGDLRTAFTAANPGLPRASLAIIVTKGGYLSEVRLCKGLRYEAITCDVRGAPDDARVKVTPARVAGG